MLNLMDFLKRNRISTTAMLPLQLVFSCFVFSGDVLIGSEPRLGCRLLPPAGGVYKWRSPCAWPRLGDGDEDEEQESHKIFIGNITSPEAELPQKCDLSVLATVTTCYIQV